MEKDVFPESSLKAWVVTVTMGYGHQRTAYPLRKLAYGGEIVNADRYPGILKSEREIWESSQKFYEFLSNFKKIPLVGELTFKIFDRFQEILKFYPKRDLSAPNFQLKRIFSLIEKGWGKHFIEKLIQESPSFGSRTAGGELPFISTFFVPAFMAEFFNYPGEIFCVVCDADISRTWAPLKPASSRIKYFVPNERVFERLELYGVRHSNIFLTGYPLPLENIGFGEMEILKEDLRHRLLNLDINGRYSDKFEPLIKKYLGGLPRKSDHPLTLMFSVGGTGVQREFAPKILKSLSSKIREGQIKIILSAGIKEEVREYFEKQIKKLKLTKELNKGVEIIFANNMNGYFEGFNRALRKTDILWTKPSELCFYTALGLPIIIAPPVGSQEEFNRQWLWQLGSGIRQEKPEYVNQWLFDLLESGWFASAAMEGFIKAEKMGTLNIQKIISS